MLMSKLKKICVYATCLCFVYFMCNNFDLIAQAVKKSVSLCISVIVPSLFPFFIISEFLICFAPSHYGKVVEGIYEKLFKFSKSTIPIFISGIICGYPVGAAGVCLAYQSGMLSKSDAEDLVCFTNNSGPLFVICAVGGAMLGSIKTGVILYIIHIASAIITGIIIGIGRKSINNKFLSFKTKTVDPCIIENAFFKCIKISGCVIIFSIVSLFVQKILNNKLGIIICSLLEITNGIHLIIPSFKAHTALCIISFLLSFSGISVLIQVLTVTQGKLSLKKYFIYKLISGLISAILTSVYAMHTKHQYYIYNMKSINILLPVMITTTFILLFLSLLLKSRNWR